MIHTNGDLLCAIDIETTGLDVERHEIWQIACIPLNADFVPEGKTLDLYIAPDHPDRREHLAPGQDATFEIARSSGLDKELAKDLFDRWFRGFGLPENKRLIPVVMNWAGVDKPFLEKFFGITHMSMYFDARVRDLMRAATFLNDHRAMNTNPVPFAGPRALGLKQIARALGIDTELYKFHDAVCDATITALCYRKLLFEVLH